MTQISNLRSEFNLRGYLKLKNWADESSCHQLIERMREIVTKKSPSNFSQIFDTAEQKHAKDAQFIDSARTIACFFDKNAQKFGAKNPFSALNKVGHALHELCPVYRRFSYKNQNFELLKELGCLKPELIQSMFIFKQPRFGDEVLAHQDATYIYTEPDSLVGLWFALEDATIENGCLWVLPGAHKGPLKERFVYRNGGFSFVDKQRIDWPKKAFVPLIAKAGEVIVLHGLLPHYSQKNQSNKTRFAYTLHFIDKHSYFPKDNWLRAHQH